MDFRATMPYSKQNSDKRDIRFKKLLKKSSIIHYRRLIGDGYPIDYITKNVIEILGFSDKEFLGEENHWLKRIHPEDRSQVQEHYDQISSPEADAIEYRFKHKSGQYIWLRDEIQLAEPNDGGQQFLSGFITPLPKSEKSAITEDRERQKLQQLALDNLNDMVVITKALLDEPLQSHIVFVNKSFEEFTGYRADEVIGEKPTFLHGPETSQKAIDRINKKIKEHQPLREEFVNYKKDGTAYWVELDMAPFPTDDQKYEYWVGINRDITKRKQAELKLEESEKRYRSFFELSFDAIFEVDVDGNILKCNKRACELFGYDRDELIGMHVLDLTPEKYHDKQPEIFAGIATTGDEAWERLYRKKDGTVFPTEIHTEFYEMGGQKRLIAYVRDNTEHKEHEQTIQRSLKEKETLLAEVHHRVKNNLAIISGLLQMQVFNTEDEKLLAKLKESQARIQSIAMVHEKLYSSESFSEVAIDKYINDLLSMIEGSMSDFGKDITVEMDVASVFLTVGQAIPCGLLLNELITNCYKHAFNDRDDGNIRIALEHNNGQVVLSVEDNGSGLPQDFDVESESSLGMTIVNTLKDQLNGSLEVESDDWGTRFTLIFDIEK